MAVFDLELVTLSGEKITSHDHKTDFCNWYLQGVLSKFPTGTRSFYMKVPQGIWLEGFKLATLII